MFAINKRFLTVLLMLAAALVATNAYSYPFAISNGATDVDVEVLTDAQTAEDYYNYIPYSGYPPFGPEANTGFFWLYEDSNSGEVSLGMIFNERQESLETASGGNALIQIAGLLEGSAMSVQDDAMDVEKRHVIVSEDTWEIGFRWYNNNTDGAVISGLTDFGVEDEITISLLGSTGIDAWYFLSGDAVNPDRIALDMGQALTIYDPPPPTPTPEPATLFLVGSGLLGMGALRRRKGRG